MKKNILTRVLASFDVSCKWAQIYKNNGKAIRSAQSVRSKSCVALNFGQKNKFSGFVIWLFGFPQLKMKCVFEICPEWWIHTVIKKKKKNITKQCAGWGHSSAREKLGLRTLHFAFPSSFLFLEYVCHFMRCGKRTMYRESTHLFMDLLYIPK